MIRTIPYGINVGQVITLISTTVMGNGKIAAAGVRYEVRVIYPGGIIIRPASLMGRPFLGPDGVADDPDTLVPGGFIKVGTPVHVEGEPEPTEEEMARLVNIGSLPTSVLKKDVSDAADFFARPALTGVWDYRVDQAKRVASPRQASIICDIVIDSGRTEFLESELLQLMKEQGSRFNSRQDPVSIFKYYRKTLTVAGFIQTR